MTLTQLKSELKEYIQFMPSKVIAIHGQHLPPIRKCENYMMLAGRSIMLHSTPKYFSFDENPEYWAARNALHDLYYQELEANEHRFREQYKHMSEADYDALLKTRREEWYNQYVGKFVKAYVALLREEAKLGCVRIPALCRRFKLDTKVPSHYGKWELNYSPVLTEVPTPSFDGFKHIAKILAKALIMHEPCQVLSVQLKNPVDEPEYIRVQSLMRSFCSTYNVYLVEEFEEKRNDIHYQHRDDNDPAEW